MDRLKVLVVDDESRMRKLVRDFLVKSNFDVLEAGDGEEALDVFYKEKNIALIILDVMMPKLNGWEVCKEIRETSTSVLPVSGIRYASPRNGALMKNETVLRQSENIPPVRFLPELSLIRKTYNSTRKTRLQIKTERIGPY